MNNNETLSVQLIESEIAKTSLKSETAKENHINNYLKRKLAKSINDQLNNFEKYERYNIKVNGYPDKIRLTTGRKLNHNQINSIISIIGLKNYQIDSYKDDLIIDFRIEKKDVFKGAGK